MTTLHEAAAKAEPVAYRRKGSDGMWHLFHQATGWKDCSGFEPLFTHPAPPAGERAEFAELIILECAEICRRKYAHDDAMSREIALSFSNDIKKHFGVKE